MIPFAEIDHILLFVSFTMLFSRTLKAPVAIGALACACVFVTLDGHFWLGEILLPLGKNPQIATAGLLVLTALHALPDAHSQQVEELYRFYQDHKSETEVGHGLGVFNDLGEDGVSVFFHQSGDNVRVIVDSKVEIRMHAKVRDLFYLPTTVAHGVWLFGSLSLIAFHRMRFRRSGRAN